MKLYILRHGIAEDRAPGMADADRRLTREGAERMRREARAFARIGVDPEAIVTSPLPRARETAEIVAQGLGLRDALRIDERLASAFGLGECSELVTAEPSLTRWMLVGHEPTLSLLASRLTGGSLIELKKGGLILVETDRMEPGAGRLKWLLTPATIL
jgi:phosphohistidine phosphatase